MAKCYNKSVESLPQEHRLKYRYTRLETRVFNMSKSLSNLDVGHLTTSTENPVRVFVMVQREDWAKASYTTNPIIFTPFISLVDGKSKTSLTKAELLINGVPVGQGNIETDGDDFAICHYREFIENTSNRLLFTNGMTFETFVASAYILSWDLTKAHRGADGSGIRQPPKEGHP